MKLIVGLGNPGEKYQHTRHNAGFLAVDYYLKNLSPDWQSKFKSEICQLVSGTEIIMFAKPQTFMNNSGEAVKEICDFYKIEPEKDLLVIHDDKDLPIGISGIREADDSSSAGHNGVQNIIDKLGTQNFHRIRIGIARPDNQLPTDAFVLQDFPPDDWRILQSTLPDINAKIENFLKIKKPVLSLPKD